MSGSPWNMTIEELLAALEELRRTERLDPRVEAEAKALEEEIRDLLDRGWDLLKRARAGGP